MNKMFVPAGEYVGRLEAIVAAELETRLPVIQKMVTEAINDGYVQALIEDLIQLQVERQVAAAIAVSIDRYTLAAEARKRVNGLLKQEVEAVMKRTKKPRGRRKKSKRGAL